MLRGGLGIINEPLVGYRRHGSNAWAGMSVREALSRAQGSREFVAYATRYRGCLLQVAATYRGMREDLRRAHEVGWVDAARARLLSGEAYRQELIYRLRARLLEATYPGQVLAWLGLAGLGAPRWVLRDVFPLLLLPWRHREEGGGG